MKKIVLAAAALAMAASTSTFAAGKAKLKVWESDGPEKNFIQQAIKDYKKINKNVSISYEPVASTDARAKIELDGPAGVGADVFVTPHDHIGALVAGGHVLPVDDADAYMEDFLPMAKTGASYDGVVYGYPLGAETYALFYNKNLCPNPPKTWDEVIAFAKKFNLPIIQVLEGGDITKEAWTQDGIHINSEFLNGLGKQEAIDKMIEWLEEKLEEYILNHNFCDASIMYYHSLFL